MGISFVFQWPLEPLYLLSPYLPYLGVLRGPAVDVLPMTDFHGRHHKLLAFYHVDDPVDALANSIEIATR